MTKPSEYTRAVALSNGVTVTVQAWTLADIASHSTEFMTMLEACVARIKDQPALLPDVDTLRLMERTVRFSLSRPEDTEHVRAPDLAPLMEAIWQVNGLGDLVGELLRLRLSAHERQARLMPQESPDSP